MSDLQVYPPALRQSIPPENGLLK